MRRGDEEKRRGNEEKRGEKEKTSRPAD